MKLTAEMLLEKLPSSLELTWLQHASERFLYRYPMFWEAGSARQGVVYLGDGAALECVGSVPAHSMLILTGEDRRTERLGHNMDVLLVKSPIELTALFNQVQAIFAFYQEKEQLFLDELEHKADIVALTKISAELLENPVSVYDENIRQLSSVTRSSIPEDGWQIDPTDVFLPETFLKVHTDKNFSKEGAVFLRRDYRPILENGRIVFEYNLYAKETYLGCVCLKEEYHTLTDADRDTLFWVGGFIQKALERKAYRSGGADSSPHESLKELLAQHPIDQAVFLQQLSRRFPALSGEEHYTCFAAKPYDEQNYVPLEYICSHLEQAFPDCLAVIHKEQIVFLWRMEKITQKEILKKLTPFLQLIRYQIGGSLEFSNLARVYFYYRQACLAMEMGEKENGEERQYLFERHQLRYMLQQSVGEFPVDTLMPTGLQHILEHDQTSATSYRESLFCYLKNELNATRTAQKLYIHRSSFLQRMTYIEEMLEGMLDDADSRLLLRLLLFYPESIQ